MLRHSFLLALLATFAFSMHAVNVPPVHHCKVGDHVSSADGAITLTVEGQKLNYFDAKIVERDTDVWSPKSAHFHPNGKKYYINSLEGCRTLVYDAKTNKKITVIDHHFTPQNEYLWAKPSGLFPFTHYTKNLNYFWGRPVESTFSHGGRYLWVPYYRRSFDYNAQDPSAISVIDTKTDTIIRMMETGPLPKMVATSHNGKYLAVSHWGNNTVGIIDISSSNPKDWHYIKVLVVDYQLKLNFSLTEKVDRDVNSGYMLRGTVFTPDDHYMLITCMGGEGGIAVIDMTKMEYVGRLTGVTNARHLVIKNDYLYVSRNAAGIVQRLPLKTVVDAIGKMNHKVSPLSGWEQCQVGRGARTISLSPSGNYAFAACNSASQLCVVDTRTMKMVAALTLDSYPVGLDMSADGRHLVVTSQGRSGHGGNAINLIRVDYKVAEPDLTPAEPADSTQMTATNQVATELNNHMLYYIGGAIAILLIIIGFIIYRKKK